MSPKKATTKTLHWLLWTEDLGITYDSHPEDDGHMLTYVKSDHVSCGDIIRS